MAKGSMNEDILTEKQKLSILLGVGGLVICNTSILNLRNVSIDTSPSFSRARDYLYGKMDK